MHDIARPSEVRNDRNGATRQRLKDHACAKVANGRKYQRISGSQLREDLRVVNPTTEVDCVTDSKGCHKLLQAVPFRPISKDREAGRTVSQKRGSRSQRQITGFARDQPTNKDQLEFGIRLRTALIFGA
jgi:hypothetical protein